MNDFSAEWLQLREPADHRSRNQALSADVVRLFADKKAVRIVDLGSGLGSNLRALAPQLPCDQQWRLLDHDVGLLDRALTYLNRWKPGVKNRDALTLSVDGRSIDVRTEMVDLAHNVANIFTDTPDLVTAAALFDLVSADWIDRLADALAERRIPLYTTLIYNGEDHGNPAHPLDAAMIAALHVHQHRDKGFGPAAGPDAIEILQKTFTARGFSVRVAPSPWTLGDDDAAMLTMLGEGVVAAVRETDRIPAGEIAAWQRFHMPDGRWRGVTWTVGQADFLAVPKSSP